MSCRELTGRLRDNSPGFDAVEGDIDTEVLQCPRGLHQVKSAHLSRALSVCGRIHPVDKADRERSALLTVYSASELDVFVHQDRPDFRLSRFDGPEFGVEITDIYPTEAHARVWNRPEYMARLFEGGPHMDKDDIAVLKVVRVQIADPDGTMIATDLPAVLQEVPTETARRAALASAIRMKSVKAAAYDGDLSHENLIVNDHFPAAEDGFAPYLVVDLLADGVREALLDSPFREVFVVSRDRSGATFYRPLYLIMLMEQFSLFGHAIDAFASQMAVQREQFAPLFVHAMQDSAMTLYYSHSPGGGYAVSRCKGVRLTDQAVELVDSRDFGAPKPSRLPDLAIDGVVWNAFCAHFQQWVAENTMELGITLRPATPQEHLPAAPGSMSVLVEHVEPAPGESG